MRETSRASHRIEMVAHQSASATKKPLGKKSLAFRFRAVAAQWHPTKNGDLTPRDIAPSSKDRAWWRCDVDHEWQAAIYTRTYRGYGCPICSKKVVMPGVNDLATVHPDIAAQWHPTKNGTLTPRQIMSGARKMLWWVCDAGHEWQSTGAHRVNGHGCPICTNQSVAAGVNDLASQRPDLARQWHATKNKPAWPDQVLATGTFLAWWKCDNGHVWQATVAQRVRGNTCPRCR